MRLEPEHNPGHDSDPADLVWLGLVIIVGAAVAVGLLVWWVLS